MSEKCPVCGEGNTKQVIDWNPVSHNGVTRIIKMIYLVCNTCGSETAGSKEMHYNKEQMQEFIRSVEDEN